jgi:hypothetical protein
MVIAEFDNTKVHPGQHLEKSVVINFLAICVVWLSYKHELAFADTPGTSLAHESGYSFPAMVAA